MNPGYLTMKVKMDEQSDTGKWQKKASGRKLSLPAQQCIENFENEKEKVSRKYFQISCAFAANLMMACYGLVVPSSGFLIPQLENPDTGFGIDKEEGSWFASIMIAGRLTGSICGGWQCEKFGRKKSLMVDSTVFIVGIILSAFAPNFFILLIARILLGHSMGSAVVASPIYTSEISQPEVRRITGSFPMTCNMTGYALAVLLGALFPWRYALGIMTFLPLITFILLFICPESPVWLMNKGKNEEARHSLMRLRGANNTELIQNETDRISTSLKMDQLNANQKQSLKEKLGQFLKLLKDPTFMKPIVLLLVLICIGNQWAGFAAIANYMVPLLMSSDIPIDPYWAAAMLSSYRAFLSIFGSSIFVRFKRRPIYITCCGIIACGTILMAFYCYFNQNKSLTNNFLFAKWLPIISIALMYTGFASGFATIPYMFLGELLPSHARSLGSSLIGIVDNLVLFFGTKMVPTMFAFFGIHGSFVIYSCVVIFVGVFSYFFMPETDGMSLEEIEEMYEPVPKKMGRRFSCI